MTETGNLQSQADSSPDRAGLRVGGNIVLVTAARVSLLAAWFGATMLVARTLGRSAAGPAALALYTLCTNAIRIITSCIGDPLDMAVMREAPLFLRSDRPRALEIIRSAFWVRVGLGGLAIAMASAIPWVVAWLVFQDPRFRFLAVLTAAGVLGDLLLRSVLGFFQLSERFVPFILTDAVWQLGRTAAVVALVMLNLLTARNAILLYVIAPYAAFAIAAVMLPRDVLTPARLPRHRLASLYHYSKWMVLATVMAAIYERLDIFMLNGFRGHYEAGIYAAAMTLAVIPDFIDGAVQTVLAPKVAPAFAAGTFNELQRWYLKYAIPLGVLAAAGAMLLGGPVIRILLGNSFALSVGPFKILVLSTIFNVVFTPLPAVLLNFVAPQKVTGIALIGLGIVLGGGVVIIPIFGIIGAAWLILAARVTIGTVIVLMATAIARQAGGAGCSIGRAAGGIARAYR